MTEEDTKGTEELEVKVEEEEVNADEQLAREQGWRPKEEWNGDPNDWVNYDEFNRRKPFFDAIHKVNQKNKRLEEQLNALTEHHRKVEQTAYERAKKELVEARKEAAKENDLEKVVAIDEQLDALKGPVETTPAVDPKKVIADFAAENKWYSEDRVLRSFANGIGADIERENPNMPISELLEKVKEEVKKAFPQKFQQEQRSTVSSVSPSRPGPNGPGSMKKKKITYNDLPDEAKDIYNKLVKSPRNPYGKMTGDQYLKEYAAISGLPYEE